MRMILNAFLFAALLGFGRSSEAAIQPVKVDYSPSEDLTCSVPPGSPIKEEWKAELLSRQSELLGFGNLKAPALWQQRRRFLAGTFLRRGSQPGLPFATLHRSPFRARIESQLTCGMR